MITKDEFLRRASKIDPNVNATTLEADGATWDTALSLAGYLAANMPGIGILSERKRFMCFVVVCGLIDRAMEESNVSMSNAMLAILILQLSHPDFAKAMGTFMSRAPRFSSQETLQLPLMAIEFVKAAKGR